MNAKQNDFMSTKCGFRPWPIRYGIETGSHGEYLVSILLLISTKGDPKLLRSKKTKNSIGVRIRKPTAQIL